MQHFNLVEISRKREKYLDDIAMEYDVKLSQDIRAHFVDLFRKAYKVDPGLVAVRVGMGVACVSGVVKYEATIETINLNHISYKDDCVFHPETRKLLTDITTYSELLCGNGMADLPYFTDITVTDLP